MKFRKLSLIMCLVLLTSLFTACSGNEKTQQALSWKANYSTFNFTAYKDGVFFSDKNNILHYFDASSKEDVILCDKKDCQHSGKSCHGYVGYSSGYSVFGDNIYTLNSEEAVVTVIKSDIDYTNPEEIAALGKELAENGYYVFPGDFRVSGDYIYYLAEVSNFDTGESYYGIYCVNTKTGKETTVIDQLTQASNLSIIAVCGSEIIYLTTHMDEDMYSELYESDLQGNNWEEFSRRFMEYEKQRTYNVYKYNVETGENTVIYENKAAASPIFADDNFLYGYTFTVNDSLTFIPEKYFAIDLKTHEEKTIGKDEFEKKQRGFSESEADAITGGSDDLNIYFLTDSGYIGTRTDKKVQTGENSYTITGKSYVLIDKNNPQSEPFAFYSWED